MWISNLIPLYLCQSTYIHRYIHEVPHASVCYGSSVIIQLSVSNKTATKINRARVRCVKVRRSLLVERPSLVMWLVFGRLLNHRFFEQKGQGNKHGERVSGRQKKSVLLLWWYVLISRKISSCSNVSYPRLFDQIIVQFHGVLVQLGSNFSCDTIVI